MPLPLGYAVRVVLPPGLEPGFSGYEPGGLPLADRRAGGGDRNRTGDLVLMRDSLYQLGYSAIVRGDWFGHRDSNPSFDVQSVASYR